MTKQDVIAQAKGLAPERLFSELVTTMSESPDARSQIIDSLKQVVKAVEDNGATDVLLDIEVSVSEQNELVYVIHAKGT